MPTVKAVMTPFPHSVDADASLAQARAVMLEHEIRHLPVKGEHGDLIGVLTDRDLKRALDPDLGLPAREELLVRDVFVRDGYVVELHAPLDRVLLNMAERHIGSALVVHRGRLAGIFTATDACRAFGELLRDRFGPSPGDEVA